MRFGLSVEFVVGGDITFDGGGDFFLRDSKRLVDN